MREFVKHLAISLREDAGWEVDDHWASNTKLGVSVWVSNGWIFTHVKWYAARKTYGTWGDDVKLALTLLEKLVIWRAYKKMRKSKRVQIHDTVLESIIERRLTTK